MTRPSWDASEHDPDSKHDERGHSGGDATDRDTIEHQPNPDRRGRWLSVAVGVLGLVLIGQAVALEVTASAFWNAVFLGTALVAVGAYNYYRRSKRELGSAAVATLAAVVGLWLVASPFVVGSGDGTVTIQSSVWITVSVGLLAFGVGSYSAAIARRRRRAADARPTAVYDRRGQ